MQRRVSKVTGDGDVSIAAPLTDSADPTVAGVGQGFSFGDLHTMNLPGAPKLPPNPIADAAWRRRNLSGISAHGINFSKDGAWMTYVTFPQGELWRCRIDGSERLQLTFHPMIVHDPHW